MTYSLSQQKLDAIEEVLLQCIFNLRVHCVFLIDMAGNVIANINDGELDHDIHSLAALAAGNFGAVSTMAKMIGEDDFSLLFDVGYSNIFLSNAARMGIDLCNTDAIVLSHGHRDHTWGLEPLIRYYAEFEIENRSFKRPELIAHPLCIKRFPLDVFSTIEP